MREKPSFPLEKILSITSQEYVGPNVAVKDKYDVRGIHLVAEMGNFGYVDGNTTLMEKFANEVPRNAEVVVNYRDSLAFNNDRTNHERSVSVSAHADALIPKKKTSKKK